MSINDILGVIQRAAKVVQEVGKLELYKQLIEINDKLLDQQKRITDLEAINKKLQTLIETKGTIKFEDNSYWIEKEGPFCTYCWDSETKLLRLHKSDMGVIRCPKCKTVAKSRDISK